MWRIVDNRKVTNLNYKFCADFENYWKILIGRAPVPADHDGPWPRVRLACARWCRGGLATARLITPGAPTTACHLPSQPRRAAHTATAISSACPHEGDATSPSCCLTNDSTLPHASLRLPWPPPMCRTTAPECTSTCRHGRLLLLPRAIAAPRKAAAVSTVRVVDDRLTPTSNRSGDAYSGPVWAPVTSPTSPRMPAAIVHHRRRWFPSVQLPPRASTQTACFGRRPVPPAHPRAPQWCPGALRPDHWRHPPPLRPVDVESPPPDFTIVDGLALVSFPFPQPPKSVLLTAVVPLGTALPHLIADTSRNRPAAAARYARGTLPYFGYGPLRPSQFGWAWPVLAYRHSGNYLFPFDLSWIHSNSSNLLKIVENQINSIKL
jgi:hypothetical protein